jgi:large subunit ribosomal protein L21
MYAVIKTGGKQYRVAPGEKLKIEQIPADIGAEITIDQVLAVGSGDQLSVGAPLVDGATVSATVIAQGRHDKVRIFKMRRRKHYRKTQGHRQPYTEIFISKIASALGTVEAEAAAPVRPASGDDLTIIEGIGPKIAAEVLGKAGIRSFADLAGTPVERLRELLSAAGSRFAAHDPGTWPEQAALAAKGDFEGLEKLKAELVGGKRA